MICLLKNSFFLFFFCRNAPVAHGGFQAGGRIEDAAAAASLHHSHGNTRSEPCLWPTLQSWQCWILNLLSGARDQILVLMDTSQVHYCWAIAGTPDLSFKLYRKKKGEVINKNTVIMAFIFTYLVTLPLSYFIIWLWFTVVCCPSVSAWMIPFSISCRTSLLVTNFISLCLSWKIFVSPSFLKENYAECNFW